MKSTFPDIGFFFGGSIDEGESAPQGAARELLEETGYRPSASQYLKSDFLWNLDDLAAHAFYGSLSEPLDRLRFNQGMDLGLLTIQEVKL